MWESSPPGSKGGQESKRPLPWGFINKSILVTHIGLYLIQLGPLIFRGRLSLQATWARKYEQVTKNSISQNGSYTFVTFLANHPRRNKKKNNNPQSLLIRSKEVQVIAYKRVLSMKYLLCWAQMFVKF